MGTRLFTFTTIACLVLLLALSQITFGFRIYTTQDGTACYRYTWGAPDPSHYEYYYYWSNGTQLSTGWYCGDPPWDWYFAVVQMPITSLHGASLAPGSVKLWFYSYGSTMTHRLQGMNYDPGGAVSTDNIKWMYSHTNCTTIATFPIGITGWIGVDVTSQVQARLDAGNNWAGFYLAGDGLLIPFQSRIDKIGAQEGGYAAYLEVVPEPSSLLALIGGVAGLGFFIRRR